MANKNPSTHKLWKIYKEKIYSIMNEKAQIIPGTERLKEA